MAKVIVDEQNIIVDPWWAKGQILYIGLGVGALWWTLTALLRSYVIEPIACRDLSVAQVCSDAYGVAGAISAIVVAVIGLLLLIRYVQPRPVIVAVGALAVLWSLGHYLQGLGWLEALVWSIVLYVAAYILFWLIARILYIGVSIAVAVVTALAIRVLLLL